MDFNKFFSFAMLSAINLISSHAHANFKLEVPPKASPGISEEEQVLQTNQDLEDLKERFQIMMNAPRATQIEVDQESFIRRTRHDVLGQLLKYEIMLDKLEQELENGISYEKSSKLFFKTARAVETISEWSLYYASSMIFIGAGTQSAIQSFRLLKLFRKEFAEKLLLTTNGDLNSFSRGVLDFQHWTTATARLGILFLVPSLSLYLSAKVINYFGLRERPLSEEEQITLKQVIAGLKANTETLKKQLLLLDETSVQTP